MRPLSAAVLVAITALPSTAATFTVTSNASSGAGSLREAITAANAAPDPDVIVFNIGGGGPQTIDLFLGSLPTITAPVTIDATTQPGYSGTPIITLQGRDEPGNYGFRLQAAGTIRGFVILTFFEGVFAEVGGNVIQGNHILRSRVTGIELTPAASSNLIGGSGPAGGNRINDNGAMGMIVYSSNNTIQGNEIVRNRVTGIQLEGANNQIGGTLPGARNVIQGSNGHAIQILSPGNRIEGNRLSGGAFGTLDVSTTNTIIGGTSPGAGNVVFGGGAGGTMPAIRLVGTGHQVLGNFINIDESGAGTAGHAMTIGGSGNTIGGTTLAARNFIVGLIRMINSSNNIILGNSVGGGLTGNPIGGEITTEGPSNGNVFGGSAAGAGNTIFGPLSISGGTGNLVRGNSFRPPSTGIQLEPHRENDPLDADIGPNHYQNTPIITSALRSNVGTTITGTLSSAPSTTYTLELFDGPVCRHATPIGTAVVTTDASGNVPFVFTAPVQAIVVTATATDPANNTSELAPCVFAGGGSMTIDDVTVDERGGAATFTITLAPAQAQPVVVIVDTTPGTATPAADYVRTFTRVTFAPGETTKQVAVQIVQDDIDENDETFFVSLAHDPAAINFTITDNLGIGTIRDDDTAVFSIADARTSEGGAAVVVVTLSAPIDIAATVNYSVTGGTATAGTDFIGSSGVVTFAPGELSKTISIQTLSDGLFEPDETIIVTLSNPSRGVLGRATATVTLADVVPIPALDGRALVLLAGALAAIALMATRGRIS